MKSMFLPAVFTGITHKMEIMTWNALFSSHRMILKGEQSEMDRLLYSPEALTASCKHSPDTGPRLWSWGYIEWYHFSPFLPTVSHQLSPPQKHMPVSHGLYLLLSQNLFTVSFLTNKRCGKVELQLQVVGRGSMYFHRAKSNRFIWPVCLWAHHMEEMHGTIRGSRPFQIVGQLQDFYIQRIAFLMKGTRANHEEVH